MGTPDWQSLRDELQRFKDSGDIENIVEYGTGTEGGSTFCFAFTESADKSWVYEELRNFPTDGVETNYKVVSLEECIE